MLRVRIKTGRPSFRDLLSLKTYCTSPSVLAHLPMVRADDFVRHLLVPQPNDRLTASLALEHPWFTTTEEINQKYTFPDSADNTSKSLLTGEKLFPTASTNSKSRLNYNTASHAGLKTDYKRGGMKTRLVISLECGHNHHESRSQRQKSQSDDRIWACEMRVDLREPGYRRPIKTDI